MANTKTVLLCGVGGQGTILAADLLARAVLASGRMVKVSEIHGMAQRGGSVTTVVRFGDEVASMVADKGCADVIVSFETTEALRALDYLADGGALVVNDLAMKSLPVLTGRAAMPLRAREDILAAGGVLVPADALARKVGNVKTSNVVLIGALSASLDIPVECWIDAIASRVPPKTIEANKEAFFEGRKSVGAHA